VGVDVIGDNVTEINVTSLLQEIFDQTGCDVAALFVRCAGSRHRKKAEHFCHLGDKRLLQFAPLLSNCLAVLLSEVLKNFPNCFKIRVQCKASLLRTMPWRSRRSKILRSHNESCATIKASLIAASKDSRMVALNCIIKNIQPISVGV
jgi:hypothetical protein